MSFSVQNSLAKNTTPPSNYIGSALFLSYILAALYLTTTITNSLYTQYTNVFHSHPSSPPSKFRQNGAGKVETRDARARHVRIYAVLALVSFGSIAWHMLGFLITSFLDWDGGSTRNVLAVLRDNGVEKLGRWMLETGLFSDFARQLVGDGESAVWTQLAILATWVWNLWMAGKARQFNFTAKTMIPFIVLGQNLPISLTAALFIIQLHLAAPDVAGTNKQRTSPPTQPTQTPIASLMLPTILLNATLLALPSLRAHPGFTFLVLAQRILLLLPHTGLLKLNAADVGKSVAISGGFVVANWAMLRKDTAVWDVLTALFYKGRAVKTMGWDAVLGVVIYGALSWGGGV